MQLPENPVSEDYDETREANEICLLFHELQRKHLTDVLIEMKDTGTLCRVKDLGPIGEPDPENTQFLASYGVAFAPYAADQMFGVFTYVGRAPITDEKTSESTSTATSGGGGGGGDGHLTL